MGGGTVGMEADRSGEPVSRSGKGVEGLWKGQVRF